ncbi:hypothetical protein [Deefgea sp. CFH1-16]|uniref:hypothetical protein n=1 Tax=Deefgea sp. CFH1-16 TaxID=2675457 RepID=UPI0015F59231|nr:hypothetical protein [Deefgea sp. CFH1-16]MBM5574166.1 hypothetical protein [Deefgea sp. CFH1-16]
MVEVTGEGNFQKYLEARKPKHEFYRTVNPDTVQAEKKVSKPAVMAKTKSVTTPAPIVAAPVTSKIASVETNASSNKAVTKIAAVKTSTGPQYNFGGHQLLANNTQIDLGKRIEEDAGFNVIAKAYAEESVVLSSCNRDRPRVSGSVKALKDGKSYATTEYLTGLYNTSWHDTLNGNLVMLNRVGILRDSSAPSTPPELKIYAAYDAQKSKTAKPDVQLSPVVNIYRGTKGVLYRVFAQGAGGIQCMDVLFPLQGGLQAKNGKLLYRQQGEMFAADFQPQMIR